MPVEFYTCYDYDDTYDMLQMSAGSVTRDGASLYTLLTSLGHPAAASLSPESLDWVCEAQVGSDWLINKYDF